MMQSGYRSLITVALAACATISAVDLALSALVPLVHRREVQEGMEDLERSNPETLVIASSHARTFHSLGLELSARTDGKRSLVAIPLEFGKLTSYAWLLDHRISPVFRGGDEESARKRAALKRFIILTEWWDSCAGPDWNIPSRAWTAKDYVADLILKGSSSYNRNYVQSRWKRLFWNSALAQDRGAGSLFVAARDRIRRREQNREALEEALTPGWQRMVEDGTTCLGNPTQMAALAHLMDFGRELQLETTIVLFPRKPGTLTEKAKATTLAQFRDLVARMAAPRGVGLVDLTWQTPLIDADFMADFDHVSAEGNVKFARWALDGPLAFMMQPAKAIPSKDTP